MSENNKTKEFLQKLAPCIERGDLDACVEEAAQVAERSCDVILSNTFQCPIEDAVRVLVNHIIKENILVLGIGEKVHWLLPQSKILVPYMLKSLKLIGFRHLVIEHLFNDIPDKEWNIINAKIAGFSQGINIDKKISELKKMIENNHNQLPAISYNLSKLYDPDGLLGIIIIACELKIKLYGIFSSEAVKLTSYERQKLIRKSGLEKSLAIMKNLDKAKKERLMILTGDVHVACQPLKPSEICADTVEFIFGDTLFRDHPECPYLNLSLITGTKEDFMKAEEAIGKDGQLFFYPQFEDPNFRLNCVKLFLIRDELQNRILFMFNTPVHGNSKVSEGEKQVTFPSKNDGERKETAFFVSREAAPERLEKKKENIFSRLFKIK